MLGIYALDEQIPGIVNYYLRFVKEGGQLTVIDSIAGEWLKMGVPDSLHYIDLENGDEMMFTPSPDTISFTWVKRFRFYKVAG